MNSASIDLSNDLSPVRRQAITWTNADILSIGTLGTNFSEIQSKYETFYSRMPLKISSAHGGHFVQVEMDQDGGDSIIVGVTSHEIYECPKWLVESLDYFFPLKYYFKVQM